MNIPNNPAKAYLLGQKVGHKNAMTLAITVLRDKFGFHVKEETEDSRDTMSLQYFWDCCNEIADEIKKGRVTIKDINEVLLDEAKVKITE